MSTPERWIVIPDWDRFQHYRDREPVWIKNYRALLSKPEYVRLTFPQRGLLHGLWLLYAESHRSIPEATAYLSRQLGGRVTKGMLQSLNDAGFIEFSASKPLAPRYQVASAEAEAEAEAEKRKAEEPLATPPRHASNSLPFETDLLPFETELEVLKLLAYIGTQADEGTPQVVRAYAAKLPASALGKVNESTRTAHPSNRARYAVGALKSELTNRGILR